MSRAGWIIMRDDSGSIISQCSPEYELDEHGQRTGRVRARQFALAYDESNQARGRFAAPDGSARGPTQYPRMEKWR